MLLFETQAGNQKYLEASSQNRIVPSWHLHSTGQQEDDFCISGIGVSFCTYLPILLISRLLGKISRTQQNYLFNLRLPEEFWFPDILNRMVLKYFSAFRATEQRKSLVSGLKVVSSPLLNAGWLLSIGSPAGHLVLISGKKATLRQI